MSQFTLREQIIEVVNRLFIYTDYQEWEKLQEEVFAERVFFDMSSLGAGDPEELTALEICDRWKAGFQGLDAIHHQSGNFLVRVQEKTAHVFCYAIAGHYKAAATQGKSREFIGSYDINLALLRNNWRITGFKYTLKYINGNATLEKEPAG